MDFIKNNIKVTVAFCLGVLCSGITVYAASYLAKDISFVPSNNEWKVSNVEEAINDLYDNSYNFSNPSILFNVSGGTNTKRTASVNVEKGTYLVFANIDQLASSSTVLSNSISDYVIDLSYVNGNCKNLSGKRINSAATSSFISQYLVLYDWYSVFLCEFDEDDTLSATNFQTGTYNETISSVYLETVKIK